jgi:2-polyprenyl-3-methyl-5-hydroxy-6-metoxy-1,4-benzoquinol methylase
VSRQKAVTRTYFNRVASEWYRRTYDPSGRFESFPGNRVRKDLTLDEITRIGVRGDVLDVGCGPGALVIDLTRRGHTTFGIDISEAMIGQARAEFRKARLGNGEDVFHVADLAAYRPRRTFGAVTALGVLEYLEQDRELFGALARLTARGGYAFVEARNKLFNLYSANAYTAYAAERREVARLVDELQAVHRFSPLPDASIPLVQRRVATRVAGFRRGTCVVPACASPSVRPLPAAHEAPAAHAGGVGPECRAPRLPLPVRRLLALPSVSAEVRALDASAVQPVVAAARAAWLHLGRCVVRFVVRGRAEEALTCTCSWSATTTSATRPSTRSRGSIRCRRPCSRTASTG